MSGKKFKIGMYVWIGETYCRIVDSTEVAGKMWWLVKSNSGDITAVRTERMQVA